MSNEIYIDPAVIRERIPPRLLFQIQTDATMDERQKWREVLLYLHSTAPNESERRAFRCALDMPEAVYESLIINDHDPAPATGDRQANGQTTCVVCLDNIPAVMLWPCRHVVYCRGCSKATEKNNTCPTCRAGITDRIEVKLP